MSSRRDRLLRWSRTLLIATAGTAAIVLLLLWLMGAFHDKVEPGPARPVLAARPDAPVMSVKSVTATVFESAVGTIQAIQRIEIGSRLLARVDRMHVLRAGQAVRKGEVLVQLESRDLQAALEEARAAHRAAEAAREQAGLDLGRAEELFASKVVAQERVDRERTAVSRAEAEVERSAQAITGAETVLSYATIVAPSAGTVIDKLVEEGDLARPGEVLLTMYDPARMQLVATVREQLATSLRVDDIVEVRVDALDKTCTASIAEIVPEAEQQSRAFSVKVTGPCPPGIYSGMFGRLMVPVGERQEIRIPATALHSVGQLDMVFAVLPDGGVLRRFVRLAERDGEEIEVLSGLHAGERILVHAKDVLER